MATNMANIGGYGISNTNASGEGIKKMKWPSEIFEFCVLVWGNFHSYISTEHILVPQNSRTF
jgi:hypothetical protein